MGRFFLNKMKFEMLIDMKKIFLLILILFKSSIAHAYLPQPPKFCDTKFYYFNSCYNSYESYILY